MTHFKIFTLFPEIFPGPLNFSITGEALKNKIWSFEAINIRDYANNKHGKVDDTSCGGGSGMVIRADVIENAFKAHNINNNSDNKQKIIYLSPRGEKFCQKKAIELANFLHQNNQISLLCGRYEGIDERILQHYEIEEISIGDYIITGGEIAAITIIDSIVRNIKNVLGNHDSLNEESFGGENSDFNNLLEYPHYTKPINWNNKCVPEILLSGNHQNIKKWRLEQAIKITKERRPDLYSEYIKK